jgi:hypothetical protein
MNKQVVYPIGEKCYTELICKRLNLIKFSSIFGSMFIKNYNNVIQCFNTNFKILFDEENLLYSKDNPNWDHLNKAYGCRTLHKIFDDINDYDTATIAHHDLTISEHKEHFERGIRRLNYIKECNIPILFIHISFFFDNTQFSQDLIDSIKNNGFNNMKILSIYKDQHITETQLLHIYENHIIYKIPTFAKNPENMSYNNFDYSDERDDELIMNIISKHFSFEKLLSIEEVSIYEDVSNVI